MSNKKAIGYCQDAYVCLNTELCDLNVFKIVCFLFALTVFHIVILIENILIKNILYRFAYSSVYGGIFPIKVSSFEMTLACVKFT